MFNATRNLVSKYGSKALAVAALATASAGAFAQESTNPIVSILNGVSLEGLVAILLATSLTIVAIALTMKGPDVAKRIIRKV